jgi:hypothetical protein
MYNYIFDEYPSFQENRIQTRRFNPQTWEMLINEWSDSPNFQVKKIGESYEKRPIHEVRFGEGPIKIIAWSQMHGDEATATMALCDIFRFLNSNEPEHQKIREKLHQNCTIHFIPLLNKDGAARWTRETALGIDMNRDAVHQYSPEAKLLSDWADQIKPDFAFNLHDQNRLYSVGNSAHQTHIAFLATTGDEAGTWTESRKRAGQLANRLSHLTQAKIPNKVAKWSDEFNPRAFGDNFQKRGYGLLLVESGGAGWDLEKQSLRRLNVSILIDAFYSIATGTYQQEMLDIYEALETNERQIFDIKLSNAPLDKLGTVRADIGINLVEKAKGEEEISYTWRIEEIGDLAYMHALNDINASEFIANRQLSLGEELTELTFTKDGQISFDLRNFTAKINNL